MCKVFLFYCKVHIAVHISLQSSYCSPYFTANFILHCIANCKVNLAVKNDHCKVNVAVKKWLQTSLCIEFVTAKLTLQLKKDCKLFSNSMSNLFQNLSNLQILTLNFFDIVVFIVHSMYMSLLKGLCGDKRFQKFSRKKIWYPKNVQTSFGLYWLMNCIAGRPRSISKQRQR